MRPFKNRADYYACIIETAQEALERNQTDTLIRAVTPNISGGHYMWDEGADDIFEAPQSVEESLLALELRRVLETAAINQMATVENQARKKPVELGIFGLPMDFGMLSSTLIKLAKKNALLTLQMKIALSEIAMSTDGRTLADFLGTHCLIEHKYGEEYCSQI